MKPFVQTGRSLLIFAGLLAAAGLRAQDTPDANRKTISVETIKPAAAVADKISKAGKAGSLDQLVQSLDAQLTDRLNATHKFDVLASSDLKDILKVQARADSGNYDASDKSAEPFKLAKSEFVLITSLDDFRDYKQTVTFQGIGQSGTLRIFNLSAVGKIYNTKTGSLLSSEPFSISATNKAITDAGSTADGDLSDALVVDIARETASKISSQIVGIICPPTVVDVTGNQVTIDWGVGLPIAKGEDWEVCVKKLKHGIPVMVPVGKVKITRVDDKSTTGEIIGDNLGIAEDCVLRQP